MDQASHWLAIASSPLHPHAMSLKPVFLCACIPVPWQYCSWILASGQPAAQTAPQSPFIPPTFSNCPCFRPFLFLFHPISLFHFPASLFLHPSSFYPSSHIHCCLHLTRLHAALAEFPQPDQEVALSTHIHLIHFKTKSLLQNTSLAFQTQSYAWHFTFRIRSLYRTKRIADLATTTVIQCMSVLLCIN